MTREQLGDLILDSERQLYSTAKTILYDDQDCADAIQETIVKAFSKINTLRNDRFAKTWLIRILINECYSMLRKSGRFVPLEYAKESGEWGTEKNDEYLDLYRALDALKEELRMPLVLYYLEGFSIREIAQILSVSEGAVQKRLARARGKLRIDLLEGRESYET
ncbi:MAG: sigma-70 family RNA polymerase sigma factor [Lachnospiraceae bacterium]|nr:sigma-70 family RNA polymerase sigma factor [Lachnospiraceae bacterium]